MAEYQSIFTGEQMDERLAAVPGKYTLPEGGIPASDIAPGVIPDEIDTVNVTVDNNIGTPSASGSVSGGTLSLEFHNLKGEKGDTGPQGNPGSSQDYPFTLANNLTTDDSTVALTAAQGVVLEREIETKTSIAVPLSGTWRQGSLTSNHAYDSSATRRIVMAVPFNKSLSLVVTSGYYVSIHCYSGLYTDINKINTAAAGATWLGNIDNGWKEGAVSVNPIAGTQTFVLVVKHGAAGTDNVLPSAGDTAITNLKGITTISGSILDIQQSIEDLREYDACKFVGKDNTYQIALIKRNLCPGEKYRVYLADKNYAKNNVTGSGAYVFNINSYDGQNTETTLAGTQVGGTMPNYYEFTIPANSKYIRIGGRANDGVIVAFDIVKVQDTETVQTDFVMLPDMIKRGVRVASIGSLKYLQAFCKYNGKYYSTDGSHIAEQGSDFSVLRDISINVGHGNSLQLVGNGKAWASGWNDQKMYKVDLSTLAVESSITLPTTGYTTAAVDEANGMMYILQRTSYPDTIEAYNWIVYDYVNEQIISTRVVESFAALQSMDYYQGKIFVLFGFGTVAAPSGMRVYNTAGDVLATYNLSVFASTEPEGIQFDPASMKLLVSDVNKNLYAVE